MSRLDEPGALRVGLAIVDPLSFDSSLFQELDVAGIRATFFVRPEVLVIESVRWRFARSAGHELGNGTLLGVTDDGRLPNWTYAALDAELRDCARLLADLGQADVDTVYLPGKFHVCADGEYRPRLQNEFAVCVGDSRKAASLGGKPGGIEVVSIPKAPLTRPTIVRLKPRAGNLRRLRLALQEFVVGPVGLLAASNPYT